MSRSYFKSFLILFVGAVFSIAATVLAGTLIGGIEINDSLAWLMMFAILISAGIAGVLSLFLSPEVKDKDLEELKRINFDLLSSLRKEVSTTAVSGNSHQLKLIHWRLTSELLKFRNIYSGIWILEAHEVYAYLRYIFGRVLSTLDEGYEYLTLSNLEFWSRDNVGGENFLALNLEALSKGVRISRVIIVSHEIFDQRLTKEIEHLRELVNEFKESRSKHHEFSKMNVKFYISPNPQVDLREPVPYALIKKAEKQIYLMVIPNLKTQEGRTAQIKIIYAKEESDPSYQKYLDRFESIKADIKNLYELDGFDKLVNSL